jgi:hypothetical protein
MNAEHTVTQLAMWLGTALLAWGLGWIFGLPGVLVALGFAALLWAAVGFIEMAIRRSG